MWGDMKLEYSNREDYLIQMMRVLEEMVELKDKLCPCNEILQDQLHDNLNRFQLLSKTKELLWDKYWNGE